MKITKEDFDQWRDNPVTEDVFCALRNVSARAKRTWLDKSWNAGLCDPLLLADLRAREEVVRDLCELTFEELEEELNDAEQQRNIPDGI